MNRKTGMAGLAALTLLILLLGCSNPVTPPTAEMVGLVQKITSQTTYPNGVKYESGVLGPGALYEIWAPPKALWKAAGANLVLYAHGYMNTEQEITLPSDLGAFKDSLLAQGFAIAFSSYSENGWAVKDGAIRTRQLLGHFTGRYGKPVRTFLVGASEGGIISLMLAQQNPELFAGMLSICSLLGGAEKEMEYVFNVRILFDYFFRNGLRQLALLDPVAQGLDAALGDGVLQARGAGSGLPADGTQFAAAVAPRIIGLLTASAPTDVAAMATMSADGQPLFNWTPAILGNPQLLLPELAVTITTCLWYNLFGTEDLLDRTHGHIPLDNQQTWYASPLDPGGVTALNQGVQRLTSHPDAVNYLEHWYEPASTLKIPVVTLHTSRDPIVPLWHEYAFRQIVGSASGDLLAQFWVDGFGHCQLLVPAPPPAYFAEDPAFALQLNAAFQYLVAWSMTGRKPPDALFPPLAPLP